jgi:hypothetical protein
MNWRILPSRLQELPPSKKILAILCGGALFGALVLPAIIYLAGVSVLGRIENGGLFRLYGSIFKGLVTGSFAAWVVVFGPGILVLLFGGLRSWWRHGAQPTG